MMVKHRKKVTVEEEGKTISTAHRIKELFKDDDDVIEGVDEYDAYIYGGVSTGSLCIDMIIGRPGIPMGRLTEIAAEDDSGKTALALEIVYQAQKEGIFVVICDTERTYDVLRLQERGIDPDNILFVRSNALEDVFTTVDKIVSSLAHQEECLVIIDSIAGATTKMEEEADYGDHTVASHAKVLAKGFRKLINKICQNDPRVRGKKKVALVVVNQMKENVNMASYIRGSRLKHFGGYATKYHSSLRFTLKKTSIVFDDPDAKNKLPIAIDIDITALKNKVSKPYRETSFLLKFAEGIDQMEDIFRAGLQLEVITRKGSYYYWDGETAGFYRTAWDKKVESMGGFDKVKEFLTTRAYDLGIIKPYGHILKQDVAE